MSKIKLFSTLTACFTLLVLCIIPLKVTAAESLPENTIITVAFPEVEGFSMTDKNGKRSGIFYDYLVEISKYTGWDYEFIDGELMPLLSEVEKGKITLMGGVYYLESLTDLISYPDYDMGTNLSLLLARNDDESLVSYKLQTMNGKKIAVLSKAIAKIDLLNKFLAYNNLSCELIYYDDEAAYASSLDKSEVDLLLSSDIHKKDSYNVICEFPSEPTYIVTGKMNESIVSQLNDSLRRIYEVNPSFSQELYDLYFPDIYKSSFRLSNTEKEYIQSNPSVRIAMMKARYPLNYEDIQSQQGISRDILDLISQKTGLTFEYIYTDTYSEAIECVQTGNADVLGYFLDNQAKAAEFGLITTSYYTSLDEVIIKNKNTDGSISSMRLAIPKGRGVPENMDIADVAYYRNYVECLKKVNRREADVVYIPFSFAEEIFQRSNFSNLVILPVNDTKLMVSFALPDKGSSELYYIINKALNSISRAELSHIVSDNQIFLSNNKVTLKSLIYTYPILTLIILFAFVISVSSGILIKWKYSLKNKLIEGELKQMAEISSAKSNFLSRMSHELRTPMNAIIGLTQLTNLSGELTPSVSEKLQKINVSAQFLLSLLNDILDMSKIESLKMNLNPEPFLIDNLTTDLQNMLGFQMLEKELDFVIDCHNASPAYDGDAIRLKQILTNLLSNAVKFTGVKGHILLEIKELQQEQGIGVLRFSVKDNGIGISKKDHEKIFESFEQINTQNSLGIKGTGLGLAISSNLVRLMGGELKVDSEKGKGSEFYFTIKLPLAEMTEVPKHSTGSSSNPTADFEGMRMLLAEDNELNAEIAVSLLSYIGITIEHVTDGEKAVDMFVSRPVGYYDAILMDIQMPVMNGLAATEAIRASAKKDASTIPIIAMTANTFTEDRDHAINSGMNDFIPKPFTMEDITTAFSRIKC